MLLASPQDLPHENLHKVDNRGNVLVDPGRNGRPGKLSEETKMNLLFGVVLLLLSMVAAHAAELVTTEVDYGSFALTHSPADGNAFCVASSTYYKKGDCGYLDFNIEVTEQEELVEQKIDLMFNGDGFFTKKNNGHFAVGLQAYSKFPEGDVSRIEAWGRGVVFGNLTEYPKNVPGCGPTSRNNTVTFETWWQVDKVQYNCVMGWTQSPELKDGVYYHLIITSRSDNGVYVSYLLQKFIPELPGLGWMYVWEDVMYDYTTAAGNRDHGTFIAEVFGGNDPEDPPWTMYISEVKVRRTVLKKEEWE